MANETVDARNEKAMTIVSEFINQTKISPLTVDEKTLLSKELLTLDRLIPIKVMGFRGVVLTGIVGKMLDGNYMPTENFYGCNPRPIFESGIYYALVAARIPCGKSDPLNVAKGSQQIDYNWARRRRPEAAARAAVDYLRDLEQSWDDLNRRKLLIKAYFERLTEYAELHNKDLPALVQSATSIPIETANKLASFAVECPEGGTMPQFIVGNLIRSLRAGDGYYESVGGVDESVYGTNTTSKKPADIWEVLADNVLGGLYEVTVKRVDLKRLDDCVDALIKTGVQERIVTFICNLPEDIQSLKLSSNHINYKGVGFQFLDIRSFICHVYCLLRLETREAFILKLLKFVEEPGRALITKKYWEDLVKSS